MTAVSRRKLLAAGGAAVALPALGLLGLRGFDSPPDVIAQYLKRELPGLAVSDDQLAEFSREYHSRRIGVGASALAKKQVVYTAMQRPIVAQMLPGAARPAFDWFTRDLMTTFLFSTDFFGAAGRKPERTRFLAYADPYDVGCRNPIARVARDGW